MRQSQVPAVSFLLASLLVVYVAGAPRFNATTVDSFKTAIDNIIEETPANTMIGEYNLQCTEDIPNTSISYNVTQGGFFVQVNPRTGRASLKIQIDRDTDYGNENDKRLIKVYCYSKPFGDILSDFIEVNMRVIDINDNSPVYNKDLQNPYYVEVPETTPVGQLIFSNISVTDIDGVGANSEIDGECFVNTSAPEQLQASQQISCDTFNVTSVQIGDGEFRFDITTQALVRLNQDIYTMLIKAQDGGVPPQSSFASLTIKVQDVQTDPPVFVNLPYRFTIAENAPPGLSIEKLLPAGVQHTLGAYDGDVGDPNPITFLLLPHPRRVSDFAYFELGSVVKSISFPVTYYAPLLVKEPVDRETITGNMLLRIVAIEVGNATRNPMNSTQDIEVTIQDVNDYAPEFANASYYLEIKEQQANPLSNTYQLPIIIEVDDKDSSDFYNYNLDIISGNALGVFQLDKNSGSGKTELKVEITNLEYLDYENPGNRRRTITIKATDRDNPSLSSTTQVTLVLRDENDNSPTFAQDSYAFTVREDLPVGNTIGRINATDIDSGDFGRVTYTLGDQSTFAIDPVTGVITTTEPLDFESISEYSLIAYATDTDPVKPFQVGVDITVSINDVPDVGPVIQGAYSAQLNEDSRTLVPPVIIKAVVPQEVNTQIRYSIDSVSMPSLASSFSIDDVTGQLFVTKLIDYRTTNKGVVQLTVFACTVPTDVAASSFCTRTVVVITVNDLNNYPPKFVPDRYVAFVNETAPGGTFVVQLFVTDDDGPGQNGNVTFRIASSADNFVITETGEIFLSSRPTLDYNEVAQYELLIIGRDNGTPSLESTATVIVNVLDNNNKAPSFEEQLYSFQVFDDYAIDTLAGEVSATDPDSNSNLTYRINIQSVQYDVNSVVGTNFQTLQSAREAFRIDNTTGEIFTNSILDRTRYTRIIFEVIVEDLNQVFIPGQGPQQARNTATASVRITILTRTEQVPIFRQPWSLTNPFIKLTQQERDTIGWTLYSLYAYDPRNLVVIDNFQKIPGSDPGNYFTINGTSVMVMRKLDYEELPADKTVSFGITAISETGSSSTATIEVSVTDINDNAPVFSETEYTFSVQEGSPYGTFVGNVMATDRDSGSYSQVNFDISGAGANDFFVYKEGNNMGAIYVNEGVLLDYETTAEYPLSIYARDNPGKPSNERQESTVPLTITVIDINDNYPIFEYSEYRYTPIGTAQAGEAIGPVRAFDLDKGPNGDIVYTVDDPFSDAGLLFTVRTEVQDNFRLGMIYAKQDLSSLADNTVFNLTIRATDSGRTVTNSNTTNVIITINRGVKDPNPSWSEFTKNRTVIPIPEDTEVGTLILPAKASPQFANGTILYSFQTTNDIEGDYMSFTFDRLSGEIRTNATFDREKKRSYNLLLLATDASNSTLTSQLLVTVTITDVDDNDPSFRGCAGVPEYEVPVLASVMEEEEPNKLVYTARACDLDEAPFNKVSYQLYFDSSLCQSSIANYFNVSATSGEVRTADRLDRETQAQYLVCIRTFAPSSATGRRRRDVVSDVRNRTDHDSILYLLVTVLDANDNGPKFPPGKIVRVILEYPEVEVVVSEATDADLPPNNIVRYSIDSIIFTSAGKSQPSPTAFGINSASGAISVGSNDYRDNVGGYFTITQRAEDRSGLNNLSDTKIIQVYVAARAQQVRIVFDQPADQDVEQKTANMISDLNKLYTGLVFEVKQISYHMVANDKDPRFDKTDVCMVIIQDDEVLKTVGAIDTLTEDTKVKAVLDQYGATNPGTCQPARSVYPTGWESYWWVLVAFAIFIFLVTLILIAVVCILYEKLKRYMKSRRTYLVPE